MSRRRRLNQYTTSENDYIFQNLNVNLSESCVITDPFCADGELLKWAETHYPNNIKKGFDLDPRIKNARERDSLLNPPNYKNTFVVTNPPFKKRRGDENVEIYERWKTSEYYLAFLASIMQGQAIGGAIILPSNFFTGKISPIKDLFLSNYKIQRINVFNENVFPDSKHKITSFSFLRERNEEQTISCVNFPNIETKEITIRKRHDWNIAGDTPLYYYYKEKIFSFSPLEGYKFIGIQTQNLDHSLNPINSFLTDDPIPFKESERFKASVYSKEKIKHPDELCKCFNEELSRVRNEYGSLVLIDYLRQGLKRLSFYQAKNILNYCFIEKSAGL